MGTGPGGQTPDSLARSSHTVNLIDGDIYVFGGLVADDVLAGNEMHILKMSNAGGGGAQYKSVPALAPREGGEIPQARSGHTTCTIDGKIYMFGGYSDVTKRTPIDEKGCIWIWSPASVEWTLLDPASDLFPSRYDHAMVSYQNNKLVLHGGCSDASAEPRADTWAFDLETRIWTELPLLEKPEGNTSSSVHASAPPSVAIANDKLYLISGASDFASQIHILDLASLFPSTSNVSHAPASSFSFPLSTATVWTTLDFPTNPLTPGPKPRKGAGLLPIYTGLGRVYLLLMLGAKEDTIESSALTAAEKHRSFNAAMLPVPKHPPIDEVLAPAPQPSPKDNDEIAGDAWSGLWALQLPSTNLTPAHAKDTARDTLSIPSHVAEWGEVVVVAKEEPTAEIGLVAGILGAAKAVANSAGDVVSGHSRKPSGSVVRNRGKSMTARQGKSHPGPRGYFGCHSVDGTRVVLWGGLNAKGDREADGWMIDLEA